MSTLLSDDEITARLEALPAWKREGDRIEREHRAPDVPAAVGAIVRIAFDAETLGHHPDLTWTYTRVGISLTTHDAGGLTDLDFALATRIEAVLGGA